MSKVTPEKTHALLEKLTDYVTSKMATKEEVNGQIGAINNKLSEVDNRFDIVNNKIDKLASYVMNEVPTKKEMNDRFKQVDKRLDGLEEDLKATKQDVKSILNGMDNQVKDMEILRTEQIAIHSGLRRLETRVDGIERKSA